MTEVIKTMGKPTFDDSFSKMTKLQKLKVMQTSEYFDQAAKKADSLNIDLPKGKKTIKRGIPMFRYEVDERLDALTQLISEDDRFSKFRP